MANIFVKGTKFAATALGLLRKQVKAPGLFTFKFGIADFKGAEGDVINIKRPPVLVAREKPWRGDDAIVVDRIANSKIQVALNRHIYSAVELSPEEETLDDVDYVRDVQQPQVNAVLDFFENIVVGALRAALFVFGVTFNTSATDGTQDPRKVAIKARKLAQKAHWPLSGRYWLVGSNVSEAIASYDKLLEVDTSGLPEALRDGVVGRLAGFTIIELDALGDDESYFVHETAIAIANVAPVVPNGVTKGGGVAAGNGLAVTQLWDYDSDHLKDRSIVHAFAGATAVLDPEQDPTTGAILRDENDNVELKFQRAIKVTFGAGGSEKATYTVTITGAPTGGTFTLTVDGQTTDAIAYNASSATIASEINELSGVSGAQVTGGTFPANAKTITLNERVVITATGSFTGGTTPAIAVS